MTDALLASALLERAARDQEVRARPGKTPADYDEWRAVDADNLSWLREVVAGSGWPGRTRVGADAARAAWLLVQHADHDWPFQVRCLRLMREALRAGEVEAWQVAYLADRVLTRVGRPQLFGTQFGRGPDGEFRRLPVQDTPVRDMPVQDTPVQDTSVPDRRTA